MTWRPNLSRRTLLRGLGIDEISTYCGQNLYRFWTDTDQFCTVGS